MPESKRKPDSLTLSFSTDMTMNTTQTIPDFDFDLWCNGEEYDGVPKRKDCYRPGYLSWGKNIDRCLAIQRARGKKQNAVNCAYFLEAVFPAISDKLSPKQHLEIALTCRRPDLAVAAGWQKWETPDKTRGQWIHETDLALIAKAKELGAFINLFVS